jgi:hypothetical protein
LGCTLYNLLTAQPVFHGRTLWEVLLAHREADIPSIRETRSDAPVELDAAFRRMVAKQPQDRYQSADEVIDALEAVRSSSPDLKVASRHAATAPRSPAGNGASPEPQAVGVSVQEGPADAPKPTAVVTPDGENTWREKEDTHDHIPAGDTNRQVDSAPEAPSPAFQSPGRSGKGTSRRFALAHVLAVSLVAIMLIGFLVILYASRTRDGQLAGDGQGADTPAKTPNDPGKIGTARPSTEPEAAENEVDVPHDVGPWIEVIPLIDPATDCRPPSSEESNIWELRDGKLTCGIGDAGHPTVKFPVRFDTMDYEVFIQATRILNVGGFNIYLPTPAGSVAILHLNNGQDALAGIDDTARPGWADIGQEVSFRIRVVIDGQYASIVSDRDGRQWLNWNGPLEDVAVPFRITRLDAHAASIWVRANKSFVFHCIRVRALSGRIAPRQDS